MEGFATKLLAHSTNKQAKKIAWVHTDFEKHHWTNVIFKNKQNEEPTYSRYHQIVTVSVTVQKAFIKAFPLVKPHLAPQRIHVLISILGFVHVAGEV